MSNNFYETLWELDKANNGCSVSKRLADGNWEIPDADILLDEQVETGGKRNVDLAIHPLFHKVKEEVLERPTYKALISLLNNYIVNYRYEESTTPEEKAEINKFIATIKETAVMKKAIDYIEEIMKRPLRDGELEDTVIRLWFDLYTNYYNGKSTHYCSGFEHVFVGEGKYQPRLDAHEVKGEVSGYHNWVKFYIDEHIRKNVNYQGYNYQLKGGAGSDNPDVVTLQMTWTHSDIQGNVLAELFKKIGGFFVGTSPECELAMGTVAYYESIMGLFNGDRRRVKINGHDYNLVLYRNIRENGGRGDHIRSFYPEYKGKGSTMEQPISLTYSVLPAETTTNNGDIIITSALINPEGQDEGNEWVEIKNMTDGEISLDGWKLLDKLSRPEDLSGTLAPNTVKRIPITRSSHQSMQLGNGGGVIRLVDKTGNSVSYINYSKNDAASGQVTKFAH